MNYFEFKFKINPFKPWSEIVAAYLSDIDFDGFYDDEAGYYLGEHRNIHIGVGNLLKFKDI